MRSLIIAAVTGLTLLAGIGSAGAWERSVTIGTNRGTLHGSSEVYCFSGACYREREITGVNGNTLHSSGKCVRAGLHRWNCQGTVTGPAGNSVTRRVHIRWF